MECPPLPSSRRGRLSELPTLPKGGSLAPRLEVLLEAECPARGWEFCHSAGAVDEGNCPDKGRDLPEGRECIRRKLPFRGWELPEGRTCGGSGDKRKDA